MILPRPPDSIVGDCECLPRRHPGSSSSLELVTTLLILRMYTWGKKRQKHPHYASVKSFVPVPTVYDFFTHTPLKTLSLRLFILSHLCRGWLGSPLGLSISTSSSSTVYYFFCIKGGCPVSPPCFCSFCFILRPTISR